LLPLLISAARIPEALAVCRELEKRGTGGSLLGQFKAILDPLEADPEAAPHGGVEAEGDWLTGCIDAVTVEDERVFMTGWAVDLRERRPVSRVVAMIEGSVQGVAVPSIRRVDVAIALQLPEAEISGFLLAVRLPAGVSPGPHNMRVFAIAGDGRALGLAVPPIRRANATTDRSP
jgi:hypothetical protein